MPEATGPRAIPASGPNTPSVPPTIPGPGPVVSPGYADPLTGSPRLAPPTAAGYGPFPPGASGYGPPPTAPGYAPVPAPGFGYQTGYAAYGYVPVQKTNGLAVASLVCSLLWVFGLGGILAIVFGFIARSQIKRSGDGQRGNGLALAGIIIGFAGLLIVALFIALGIVVDHQCHQSGNCTFNTTLNSPS